MGDEQMRREFEAWISAPPYEMTTKKHSERESWPGQYIQYEVQLAWEAWQAAQRQGGEALGPDFPDGPDADGFVGGDQRMREAVISESEPREFWVLFDARADEKFIKKDLEGGGLAFFDNERDAARAKCHHANTDYKKVTYYTAPQPAVPEGYKAVPQNQWGSIKYHAFNGHQDRPAYVRFQLIQEAVRQAEAAPQPAVPEDAT